MPTMPRRKHRFACLVGNGFSASYNAQLLVPELTQGILDELAQLSGGDAQSALSSFANQFSGYKEGDFESLLTPLENVGGALEHLKHLSPVASVAPLELGNALTMSSTFVRDLYRLGFGTVLRLVAERGQGMGDATFQNSVVNVCQRITSLRSRGPIAVGTLNYDGLLHAGFLKCLAQHQVADLSAGYARQRLTPTDAAVLTCYPLRSTDDLPNSEIQIINLHGSLGWLQDPEIGHTRKFELKDLRDAGYWSDFVRGSVRMLPVLVLTNQKNEAVRQAPFNFAYQVFERRLTKSSRWLIAGYSFGDAPVNASIRRAYESRQRWRWTKPRILVLDKGGTEAELRGRVAAATGIDEQQITSDVQGLPESCTGAHWRQWAA